MGPMEGTIDGRYGSDIRPLIRAIHDIKVVLKKVAQNPAVLASYYIDMVTKH